MEDGSIHLVDYRFEGGTYSVQVWARDWREAEARLRALQMTGKVIGSDATTIPANSVTLPFAWIWVRFMTWWRNL